MFNEKLYASLVTYCSLQLDFTPEWPRKFFIFWHIYSAQRKWQKCNMKKPGQALSSPSWFGLFFLQHCKHVKLPKPTRPASCLVILCPLTACRTKPCPLPQCHLRARARARKHYRIMVTEGVTLAIRMQALQLHMKWRKWHEEEKTRGAKTKARKQDRIMKKKP